MKDCIFCKIIEKQIPSRVIYENEYALAFLDIANDSYGHTLVIPKKHFKNIFDIDSFYLNETMKVVQLVSNHYEKNCGFDGVNILNANDETAGQTVFHLHFHIIPRKKDDGLNAWPSLGEMELNLDDVLSHLRIK